MLQYWFVACMLTGAWAWNSNLSGGRGDLVQSSGLGTPGSTEHNPAAGRDVSRISSDFAAFPQDTTSLRVFERNRRKAIQSVPFMLMTNLWPHTVNAAGQQRCYSDDPLCSADGTMREAGTKPIPRVTHQITHVAQITYNVGERREEVGFIRIGLYGNDCPENVKQLLLFLSSGLITMSDEQKRDSIGMESEPVGLLDGGVVPNILLGTAVAFGVPSQSKAYAAARGMRNAGPDFVPQPRPIPRSDEPFPRPHDVAGLVSIPAGGIGNGGTGVEPDDEAYASAFLITADAIPLFDSGKMKQRVVGQVIDDRSMANLERLALLPVQKGLKGVIPGQVSGPPLLRVTVQDVGVQRVK
jgi:hypothetical protein